VPESSRNIAPRRPWPTPSSSGRKRPVSLHFVEAALIQEIIAIVLGLLAVAYTPVLVALTLDRGPIGALVWHKERIAAVYRRIASCGSST